MADTAVTNLLKRVSAGERGAVDELLLLVYHELKSVAHRKLRDERRGHTLNTTALVHEAYFALDCNRLCGRVVFTFLRLPLVQCGACSSTTHLAFGPTSEVAAPLTFPWMTW